MGHKSHFYSVFFVQGILEKAAFLWKVASETEKTLF